MIPRRPSIPLVIGLALVAIPGAYAVLLRVIGGLGTTNLTHPIPWGLWVAFYIYFIGLSAGSFLLSTLVYVFGMSSLERIGRPALFTALMMLCTGLVFILLDLGHMERFITVYTHPQFGSVLSWEILAYGLYICVLCAELWLLMRHDFAVLRDSKTGPLKWLYRLLALGTSETSHEARKRSEGWVGWVALLGLPVAIAVHGGTGAIFAVAKARPFWFSALFPIVFIVSALASGSGLLTAVHWAIGDRRDPAWRGQVVLLGQMAVGMVAFDLLLLCSDVLVGLYSNIPEHLEVFHTMLFGDFAPIFWGWQIGLGALLPIALMLIFRDRPGIAALAGLCVVFGTIAVRIDIVIPSLTIPVLPGLEHAVAHPRAAYTYFPSWIELLSSAGLIAGSGLAWIAGWSLLPLSGVKR